MATARRVALDMLARLVRAEGIGELPEVLTPVSGWRPQTEDQELDDALRDECARLGWLDPRGRLDVDVAATLAVLCRPSIEISGWITTGDSTVGVIAAAIGRLAVLAVGQGDWVSMRSVGSQSLARVVVAQTPDAGPGPGEPFRVGRADVLALDSGQGRAHGGVAVHPVPPEVRRLQEVVALGQTGAGEFRVAVRDRVGRRQVSQDTVSYVDTAAGRYVTLARVTRRDVEMFIAPTDRRALVTRLQELRQSMTG